MPTKRTTKTRGAKRRATAGKGKGKGKGKGGGTRKRPAKKWPAGMVTVSQAAALIPMTPSGMYNAIKRGEFPTKKVDGVTLLWRRDVMEGRRQRIEFYSRPKPDPLNLTDEEFLQRLWDSDPD